MAVVSTTDGLVSAAHTLFEMTREAYQEVTDYYRRHPLTADLRREGRRLYARHEALCDAFRRVMAEANAALDAEGAAGS